MNQVIKDKITKICLEKIDKKGMSVGVSFYAFFENKNSNPELLYQVAKWWILENEFDHFEKAQKILSILKTEIEPKK
ncbi:MAG: DUF6500 family protein [Patescibacteria group bacterium]